MKLTLRCLILACVFMCAACKVLPLPAYLTPCNSNDPNLNDCATKNGREGLPTLIKGDRKYKIPVLDPLAVDEISILNGNGSVAVHLVGKNLKVVGFKDITLRSTNFDLSNRVIKLVMFTPRLSIIGDYSINGKILVLPIVGHGFMNISLDNVDFTYTLKYNLVKKHDGMEYVVPYNNNMNFTTTLVHLRMDDLFNGDKVLSDNMNKFMNENWDIMYQELGPSVGDALGDILQQILTNALENIRYKDIFLTET